MSEATPGNTSGSLVVDPQKTLTFTFAGRSISALAGQSIGAALYAAGVRTFARSFKYHRPRGLFCVSGDCPNCLMEVDGRPNVRTCVEPARPGQIVEPQNAWPSLNFDLLRVFDYLDWFLPVGFYYKRFHKPRWLWPWMEPLVRHIAGLGRVNVNSVPQSSTEVEHIHVDLCVIGGGPAGMASALEASGAGVKVLLLERESSLGGHLRYDSLDREQTLHELLAKVAAQSRLRVLTGTAAFGLYEDNLLGAARGDTLLKIRAKQILVCTGGRQRPFLFANNDLPGIFLADGLLRLARLHGVQAGQRVVVLTDQDEGCHRLPMQLSNLGIKVVAVVDVRRPWTPPSTAKSPWPVYQGQVPLRALGRSRLKALRIVQADGGGEQELACDLLALASRRYPVNELLLQGGQRYRTEGEQWIAEKKMPALRGAGAAVGTAHLADQLLEGRWQGAEIAAALGFQAADLARLQNLWRERTLSEGIRPTESSDDQALQRKRFVCLCEDVTEKDLIQAMGEGFDHIETLKRYSTVNMGPCQGKMCGAQAADVCARVSGRDRNVVGATTSRPPLQPIDLCVLAADRHFHPLRRTPMHAWHEAAGAKWLDAGLWKRPEHYGDPVQEVRGVRQRVGLIDVSTLGKIEIIGPDAVQLLERVYLNRWGDLAVGRIRYGAMSNEDGILFDDGVGVRKAADHFYLTATTGNADAVFQWLEKWSAIWGLEVMILNQTPAMAAMNLAGPQSREVLAKLTTVDVSPAGLPYLAWREGKVAGVPCQLLRIGFVGELGYEIHCPSAMAGHLWESILQAGKEFNLRPFGVEAQRMLRLEKGHIIFGVDTDALSNPLEAGLEWLVRFDKPTFLGREPLERIKRRGMRSRLVGFHLKDAVKNQAKLKDMEGCQVVDGGWPVGRVTSVRHSPTLDLALGLAWVPLASSQPGKSFLIRFNDHDVAAEVVQLPFYDPSMQRQKG